MAPPKTPPLDRRRDVVALALLAVGLALSAIVLSHRPFQTPDATYPPEFPSNNLLGAPGAMLAENLFDAMGFAVYVLLAGWFVLVATLLLCRDVWKWSLRLTGWLILLPCSAVAAHQIGLWTQAATFSAGGFLGTGLTQSLIANFPVAGRFLIFFAVLALGLALTGGFVLRWAAKSFRRAMIAVWQFASRPRAWKRRKPREPVGREPVVPKVESPTRFPRTIDPKPVPISRPTADFKKMDGPVFDADYELPPMSLLEDPEPFPEGDHDNHLREQAALLEKAFTDYGVNIRVQNIHTGPVITQYEIALETGLRLNKVTALGDDLAISLKVPSIRIVAPIPGKNTVGIEVPNEFRAVVRLKELILASGSKISKAKLPLFLGKEGAQGSSLVYDLAEMPHLLIAGRTGTGKSVCLNAVIISLLLTKRPDECRMIMIDPKRVEFSDYTRIPHLMCPVVKEDSKAEAILAWAVDKMEERYELLSRARVRNIAGYNALEHRELLRRIQPVDDEEKQRLPDKMPYIVILIDEIGDLMMTMKKEVEGHIIRLAQKSRAAGIHLILATQRPTVDVITGLIKSNLPARICFQVSSRTDSRVVLDEMGADKLLGKGDMLFLQPGTSTLIRAQGSYASDTEIQNVVGHLECEPEFEMELLQLKPRSREGKGGSMDAIPERDDLYEQAIEIVVREGRGSVSLLQRALGIGYGRAARLIDFMAEDGIVGHYNGSQARDVLYTSEQWERIKMERQPAGA